MRQRSAPWLCLALLRVQYYLASLSLRSNLCNVTSVTWSSKLSQSSILPSSTKMSTRGRSTTPPAARVADMDVDGALPTEKPDAKVVIITNLTRNVVEAHLQTIFGFYGQIVKVDLPLFGKCESHVYTYVSRMFILVSAGQNRGKAALEYADPPSAHKAASHMDGGQLDGAILKVELSDLPVRTRSRSRPRPPRNGRDRVPRSPSRSRSRSRSPPSFRRRGDGYVPPTRGDSYRGRPFSRRGPPGRDVYRPGRSRTRSRSRSPIRRGAGPGAVGLRRRSPSYSRGGYGRVRRSRSRSYSVRSSRSRTRSLSRSRSRSMSYSSYSRYSRSRSRSRSVSRGRRSNSRDDIRDSRSRSPRDL